MHADRLDPALDKVEDLTNRALCVLDHRAGLAARDEFSRIGIRAIGKAFFDCPQSRFARRTNRGAPGKADERERWIEIAHRARDRARQRLVARGLIVERAVRFNVA